MNIVFFTQNRWAFANIHNGLSKALHCKGINSEIVDWSVPYRLEEFSLLNKWATFFVTNPDAVPELSSYGVPREKIIIVAHARWDIQKALEKDSTVFDTCREYCAVSDFLVEESKKLGVRRTPKRLPLGIDTQKYNSPRIVNKIKVIGYAGAFSSQNYEGEEIKRGDLVPRAVNLIQKIEDFTIQYKPHNFYMWQAMPAYYNSIDLLIVTSKEEGFCLPVLEAMAAGVHIITPKVGFLLDKDKEYLSEYIQMFENTPESDKVVTSIFRCYRELCHSYDLDEFMDSGTKIESKLYNRSKEIRHICKEKFDWSVVATEWIKMFRENNIRS